MAMTAQEELDLIDDAIRYILGGGQEYAVDGKKVTRADLKTLIQRKNDLQYLVQLESGPVEQVARWPGR